MRAIDAAAAAVLGAARDRSGLSTRGTMEATYPEARWTNWPGWAAVCGDLEYIGSRDAL